MIDTLFNTPDNIELIRDEVAAILAIELDNQFVLATNAGDIAAADYKVNVFVENDDPLQFLTAENNPFPCVVLSLDKSVCRSGSTAQNHKMMTATLLLDVYATGNTGSDAPADFRAAIKAWKTARIVRNILGAERYTYLNLQGIVASRDLKEFQAGAPKDDTAAISVRVVRVTMNVDYKEDVAIDNGVELLQIETKISDADGRVVSAA